MKEQLDVSTAEQQVAPTEWDSLADETPRYWASPDGRMIKANSLGEAENVLDSMNTEQPTLKGWEDLASEVPLYKTEDMNPNIGSKSTPMYGGMLTTMADGRRFFKSGDGESTLTIPVPGDIRDAQDLKEYMEEQVARSNETAAAEQEKAKLSEELAKQLAEMIVESVDGEVLKESLGSGDLSPMLTSLAGAGEMPNDKQPETSAQVSEEDPAKTDSDSVSDGSVARSLHGSYAGRLAELNRKLADGEDIYDVDEPKKLEYMMRVTDGVGFLLGLPENKGKTFDQVLQEFEDERQVRIEALSSSDPNNPIIKNLVFEKNALGDIRASVRGAGSVVNVYEKPATTPEMPQGVHRPQSKPEISQGKFEAMSPESLVAYVGSYRGNRTDNRKKESFGDNIRALTKSDGASELYYESVPGRYLNPGDPGYTAEDAFSRAGRESRVKEARETFSRKAEIPAEELTPEEQLGVDYYQMSLVDYEDRTPVHEHLIKALGDRKQQMDILNGHYNYNAAGMLKGDARKRLNELRKKEKQELEAAREYVARDERLASLGLK